jgi:hypothetical protein
MQYFETKPTIKIDPLFRIRKNIFGAVTFTSLEILSNLRQGPTLSWSLSPLSLRGTPLPFGWLSISDACPDKPRPSNRCKTDAERRPETSILGSGLGPCDPHLPESRNAIRAQLTAPPAPSDGRSPHCKRSTMGIGWRQKHQETSALHIFRSSSGFFVLILICP